MDILLWKPLLVPLRAIGAALVLLAVCATAPVAAATAVSGAIVENTTWTAAASPYRLSGEVTVENGASLRVEPGVTLLMEAGAGLRVVQGALSAQGTAAQPIVMTSVRDVAGSTAAQPGDWGRLTFHDGTNDANTVLSHLRIRYGSGVAIEAASPRIDDTDISNHAAAAIAIDLASSPVGSGLSASGNRIDGILVPAGVVVGDVAWRLKGIAYVVADDALVEVGLPPFGLTPAILQLVAGDTGSLKINLAEPAPAGGASVALDSSAAQIASVVSPVIVAEGAYQADVSVSAHAAGSAQISASLAGHATVQATVSVSATPSLWLSNPGGSLGVGRSRNIVIARNGGSGALVVSLSTSDSSVLQVPASVTIAAGQSSASVEIGATSVGYALLRAEAPGYETAQTQINTHQPSILAPSLAFVAVSDSQTLQVRLSDAAPAGGLAVAIGNADSAALQVPATASVPVGADAFDIELRSLRTVAGEVTLNFSAPGYAPATTSVVIYRLTPTLGDQPYYVLPQNSYVDLPLQLSSPAPSGGLTVALSSLVPGVVDIVPAEVTIAAGQTRAATPVRIKALQQGQTSIRLQGVGLAQARNLYYLAVRAPAQLVFPQQQETLALGKGLRQSVLLATYGSGSYEHLPYPVSVALESSDPARVAVPASVTIPADRGYVDITLDGLAVTTAAVSIRARAANAGDGVADAAPLQVEVAAAALSFTTDTQELGSRSWLSLNWNRAGSLAGSGRSLQLEIVEANPAGIVDGFYTDWNGATAVSSTDANGIYLGAPQMPGSFKVRATLAGVGSWTSDAIVVEQPALVFDPKTLQLGLGLTRQDVNLRTEVAGYALDLALPGDFALSSSDPDKVEIVSLRDAGTGRKQFHVHAKALSGAQPVMLSASASGRTTAQLAVTVAPAAFAIEGLDGLRVLSAGRDDFLLRWAGSEGQTAAVETTIDLSVSDATAGVLPSAPITDAAGTALTSLSLGAGSYASGYAYVAPPLAQGSYRVRAAIAGATAAVSAPQRVATFSQLYFSWSAQQRDYLPLGRGLVGTASLSLSDAPAQDLTIRLVSRAPDWVSVPPSVRVPAGQSYAEFEVSGIEVSSDPVMIDAYVEGIAEPVASFDAQVFPTRLELFASAVRAIGGPPDLVDATFAFAYPCATIPQLSSQDKAASVELPECRGEFTRPIAPASMPVEILGAGQPPIVAGFTDTNGTAVSSLEFAGINRYSEPLFAASPTRAGSYRVRALWQGEWIESDSVVVDTPQLAAGESVVLTSPGLLSRSLQLAAVINGNPVSLSGPVELSLACTDAAICSVPSSLVMEAGHSGIEVPVTGIGLGSTTLTVTAPGLSMAPVRIEVIRSRLDVRAYSSTLAAGTSVPFDVDIYTPGGSSTEAAVPIAVDIASADPAVASTTPRITIAAGGSRGEGEVRGLSPGVTALLATAPAAQGAASSNITVEGN
ncbi:hypothetical protein DFR29_108115 [Tahibacter aquaticus]|uniref:Ig-like domain-containing protein n=1 Tax=Tahibacter aquaticus TaxID=520092 RepID=A0A4R6YV36_9GAMM|nr:hypothetical protein [Tahibacter aquaticus]TDR42531.1 hypothetical protein DFR29_108115 [Tahibacter aquaticus]